jgi:transposase
MKALYGRPVTDEERKTLRQSLKARDGFKVRRAQMILLSSDEHLKVNEIGLRLNCHGQTVRKVLRAFEEVGLACLERGTRARHDDQRAFDDEAREELGEWVRRSPREMGYETSLWTLDLLAQTSFEKGLTAKRVSGETVRATLATMGIGWRRAKHWITSPDGQYAMKKSDGTG